MAASPFQSRAGIVVVVAFEQLKLTQSPSGPQSEFVWQAMSSSSNTSGSDCALIVRDGTTRRMTFSVRMFIAVELGAWLRDAGFSEVDFFDREAEPLTVESRRMLTVARR